MALLRAVNGWTICDGHLFFLHDFPGFVYALQETDSWKVTEMEVFFFFFFSFTVVLMLRQLICAHVK